MPPSLLDLSTAQLEQAEGLYLLTRKLRETQARQEGDALALSRENIRLAKRALLAVHKARRSPHTQRVHDRSHAARLALEKQWKRMIVQMSEALLAQYDIEAAWHAASRGWTPAPDEPGDGQLAGYVSPWRATLKRLYRPTPADEKAIQDWGPGRADLAQQALDAGGQILRGPDGTPLAVIAYSVDGGAIHISHLASAPGGNYGRQALQEVAKVAAGKGLAITVDAVTREQRSFYGKLGATQQGQTPQYGLGLQAAGAAQALGHGQAQPSPTSRLVMDAQIVAQFAQFGGIAPPSAEGVRQALASGVNERAWATGAHSRYIGLALDTATEAGQVSLDHLGLHKTFEFAHPENMATDMFAQRGSKVIQNLYGDHQASLADIITQATDPRNPLTIQETTARIKAEWPALEDYQAERIARTETASVWTTMAANTYAANGISQFETIVAQGPSIGIESEDPCDECVDAAADVHSIEDDLPPWHPNCRCEAVPVLEGPDGEAWLPPDEPWTGGDMSVEEGVVAEGKLTPAPLPGEPIGGQVTAALLTPSASERAALKDDVLNWPDYSGNTIQDGVKDLGLSIIDSGAEVMVARDATQAVIGVGLARSEPYGLLVQRTAGSGISNWGLYRRYAEQAVQSGDALAFETRGLTSQAQRRLEEAGAKPLAENPDVLVLPPERLARTFDVTPPHGRAEPVGPAEPTPPAYVVTTPTPSPLPPEIVQKIQDLGLDTWPPKQGATAREMFSGRPNGDTRDLYKANGEWAPQREVLHDDIIAAHFKGKVRAGGKPVAMFTSGGGASGKSSSEFFFDGKLRTLKELEQRNDIVVIDPDAIKKMMPEFKALRATNDPYAANAVHEESSDLAKIVADKAMAQGYNVIYDTTASGDTFLSKVAKFKDANYETQVTMTSIPTNEAVVRSIQRAEKPGGASEGRFVNVVALKKAHIGASKQLAVWKDAPVVDRWRVYDNSGAGAELVAEGRAGATTAIHDEGTFRSIQAKADESPAIEGLAPATPAHLPADARPPVPAPEPVAAPVVGAADTKYMETYHLVDAESINAELDRLGVQPNELVRTDPHEFDVGISIYRPGDHAMWLYRHPSGVVVEVETPGSGLLGSFTQAQEYQAKVNALLDSLPADLVGRKNLRWIQVAQGESPQLADFRVSMGDETASIAAQAASESGRMWYWEGDFHLGRKSVFDHEVGHIVGQKSGPLVPQAWQEARVADATTSRKWLLTELDLVTPGKEGVTKYGGFNEREDWAESFRLYMLDRRQGYVSRGYTNAEYEAALGARGGALPSGRDIHFAELFPERAKLIDKWLFSGAENDPRVGVLQKELEGLQVRLARDQGLGGEQATQSVARIKERMTQVYQELYRVGGGEAPATIEAASHPAPYLIMAPPEATITIPKVPGTEHVWGEWVKQPDGRWKAEGGGAVTNGSKRQSSYFDVAFATALTLLLPGPHLGAGALADRAAWATFIHGLIGYAPTPQTGAKQEAQAAVAKARARRERSLAGLRRRARV